MKVRVRVQLRSGVVARGERVGTWESSHMMKEVSKLLGIIKSRRICPSLSQNRIEILDSHKRYSAIGCDSLPSPDYDEVATELHGL